MIRDDLVVAPGGWQGKPVMHPGHPLDRAAAPATCLLATMGVRPGIGPQPTGPVDSLGAPVALPKATGSTTNC